MFHPGQSVLADGRGAVYATYVNGVHYVYTLSGIVPARTVHDASLGAPHQLGGGASRLARGTPTSVPRCTTPSRPANIFPLRLRAA